MENNNIGTIIRNARKAKGLSQLDLSILCVVNAQQISKIETGKSKPHFSTLISICRALDLNLGKALEALRYEESN